MTQLMRTAAAMALLVVSAMGQLQSSHQPTNVSAPPSAPASVSSGKPVARVNGVPIAAAAFDREVKRIFPYFTLHGNAVPKEYEGQIRQKALYALIDAELAYQEAKRRNLRITPGEWSKRVAEVRKDYKTRAEFEAATNQLFGSHAAFEAALRHDMLLDKIWVIEVKSKSIVTEAEVRKEYDRYRTSYRIPESFEFQTISTLFPKNATDADKKAALSRLEKVLAEAKATKTPEQFGLLAEKFSEDEYRVMMGAHKSAHKGSMDPAFETFLGGLKQGEVSQIVQSSAGYHIVRLNAHKTQHQLSYEEARKDIRQSMQKERSDARNKAFHEALRRKAQIEIL